MNNLHLYITEEQYAVTAGESWPTYKEFVTGNFSSDPKIQKEIENFVAEYKRQGIKFPIKTATACQSKWTWSTIWLNELSTSSCHRVKHQPFKLEEFDDFHNIPKKLADRQLMLEGKWPKGGCEYCQDIEAAGGWSDRMHNLDIRGLTPRELETDPFAIRVSPKIVEIFAQNTCNLSCIYCNAALSSKIEQENIRFGDFNKGGVVIPVFDKPTSAIKEYFAAFIKWLENNVQGLVRLHLLGGETFIQHELMTAVLDVLGRKPNPNLEFTVFSNLNVPDKYWNLYINQFKDLQQQGHIRVFDLIASIDCWGAEQEYVRTGVNLERFEKRFEWAANEGDWLRLNVNQTVTSMTIRTMPDLIKKIAKYSKNKHIGHYFQFITGSEYQHPQNFNYTMWANDFERIYQVMPTDTVHQQEAFPRMQGLEQQLRQVKQHNFAEIKRLHIYLDELDRRRGTNWRAIFPYLDIHE
jgi:pyruvate-formate lyase-activating enzyme